jgi:hypothetical protein
VPFCVEVLRFDLLIQDDFERSRCMFKTMDESLVLSPPCDLVAWDLGTKGHRHYLLHVLDVTLIRSEADHHVQESE